jgi:hypothetical protein
MKAKGWDVQTLAGEQGLDGESVTAADPDLLVPAMKKIARAGHFHNLSGVSEDEVLASVEATASAAAEGIGKGDNYLFEADTHGLSHNCKNGEPSGDPNECDQKVAVRIKGAAKPIEVSMKKLAPLLARIRARVAARGGHFAVESRSCYGGAALKEFAAQGICAHAYSAPDTTLNVCGGYANATEEAAALPTEASSTSDTSRGMFCQGVAPEKIFGGAPPFYPAKSEDANTACSNPESLRIRRESRARDASALQNH